jgi:threonine aldolase
MALVLAEKMKGLKRIQITQVVQSNGVFVIIPKEIAEKVSKSYFFYPWNELTSEYRLMTSWDTTGEDIDNFVDLLKNELEKKPDH